MIQEKAFHLRIRKQGTRWGCACCQPMGNQIVSKAMRRTLKKILKSKKLKERRLMERIESE